MPTLLHRHLERLQDSARELGLPLEPGQLPDARAVAALIAASRDIVSPWVRMLACGSHSPAAWRRRRPRARSSG